MRRPRRDRRGPLWLPIRRASLERGHSRVAGLQVLEAGGAAAADRADELAVLDQRYAALRSDHPVERHLVDVLEALRQVVLERLGGTAEGRGDPRLVLRDGDREIGRASCR